MDKPIIKVLLSTYNGEKYLHQQLDSVLSQKNVTVRLLIRDDGSKDATLKILTEFSQKYDNVKLIKGDNIGCIKSFFSLIENGIEENIEYYAFCDQDDIWLPDKLSIAIEKIKDYNTIPTLYCSNLNVVNESGEFIRSMYPTNTIPNKEFSLLSNIATGCTCVMNKALLKLFLYFGEPNNAVMHDWWIYCLACFFGKVVYDPRAYINYRQHSSNVYGARSNSLSVKLKNILHSYFNSNQEHYREKQAQEFLQIVNADVSTEDNRVINAIANYRANISKKGGLAFSRTLIPGINFPLRLRILLGLV